MAIARIHTRVQAHDTRIGDRAQRSARTQLRPRHLDSPHAADDGVARLKQMARTAVRQALRSAGMIHRSPRFEPDHPANRESSRYSARRRAERAQLMNSDRVASLYSSTADALAAHGKTGAKRNA